MKVYSCIKQSPGFPAELQDLGKSYVLRISGEHEAVGWIYFSGPGPFSRIPCQHHHLLDGLALTLECCNEKSESRSGLGVHGPTPLPFLP